MSAGEYLVVTEADHDANAFWTLGRVQAEVPAIDLYRRLPDMGCGSPATHKGSCFLVDLHDDNGDVIGSVEVTETIAQQLLTEPIPVLRERFRKFLWDAYGATG